MKSALLTPEEFDAHLADGTLRLSFVGMSNSGKSYRSRTLARENDFLWYQVDEEIAKALGLNDADELSDWLGSPVSPGFGEREQKYLELESHFTGQAAMSAHGKNLVFDTTGSVVHLPPRTLDTLDENALVVHLDVGDDSLDQMLARFFANPKPVAWGPFFSREADEPLENALRRSYPNLLRERLSRYRALAHLNLPASDFRDVSGEETLARIRAALARG